MTQEQLSQYVIDLYLQLESEILDNIGKTLKMPEGEVDITAWQYEKLRKLGSLTAENYKYLASKSGLTVEKVKEIVTAEGMQSAALVDGAMAATPIALTASNTLATTLLTLQQLAVNKLNLVNTSMLSGAQQVYLDIVNKTTARVISGLQTPHAALREVAASWAERGVPTIRDKAGRKWSVEAYVPNVIRSTRKNVAAESQFSRMDDHGIDLIEVSSKMGARPKCAPYQGKIYSRSGKSTKYPAWSTTSYGEPDGLLGINCGHNIYPFVEGESVKRYEPYPAEKNDLSYEQSQKQRQLERNIRAKKKRLNMMKALDDKAGIKQANKMLRHQQERMREFIKETGRGRRYNREAVVS